MTENSQASHTEWHLSQKHSQAFFKAPAAYMRFKSQPSGLLFLSSIWAQQGYLRKIQAPSDIAGYVCTPRTQEAEAGGLSGVPGQLWMYHQKTLSQKKLKQTNNKNNNNNNKNWQNSQKHSLFLHSRIHSSSLGKALFQGSSQVLTGWSNTFVSFTYLLILTWFFEAGPPVALAKAGKDDSTSSWALEW